GDYADAAVQVTGEGTLGVALDAGQFAWTTGTSGAWACGTEVSHDGLDAAQSAAIADGQSSSLKLTIDGPGTLSFWWKVSSETNNERLRLYVNDSEQARISGEVDWEWRTFALPSGSQALRWKYSKN